MGAQRYGEVAVVGLVVAYNVVLNVLLPDWAHVPANLLAAGGLVLLAHRRGATLADLGLRREDAARGLRIGLLVAVPVVAVVLAGVALPWTRGLFVDRRFSHAGTGEFLYVALLRIPLATALPEEVVFRGVLLGLFLRRHSTATAVLASSVFFGLWHVLPTLESLTTSAAADVVAGSVGGTLATLVGAVLVTGAAGAGFAWLRLRSRSLVAPVVVHTALNVVAVLGSGIAVSLR